MSLVGAHSSAMVLPVAEGGGFNPFEFVPGASIWTLVIFAVALFPMWKFVFGPITNALVERDRKVEDAIQAADVARQKAEEQMAQSRQQLEGALAEARRVRTEATEQVERFRAEATAKARADAEQLLLKAREEIRSEKRRAMAEMRQLAVDLAIASASRLLKQDVDDEAHRRLVQDFLQTLPGAARN